MTEIVEDELRYIVLGNIGSDAGYWVFSNGRWHHVDGWGVESILEVQAGLAVLAAASPAEDPGPVRKGRCHRARGHRGRTGRAHRRRRRRHRGRLTHPRPGTIR